MTGPTPPEVLRNAANAILVEMDNLAAYDDDQTQTILEDLLPIVVKLDELHNGDIAAFIANRRGTG